VIFSVYATRKERRLVRQGLKHILEQSTASTGEFGGLAELNPVHPIAVLAQVEKARQSGDEEQAERLLWLLATAAPGMYVPFLMLSEIVAEHNGPLGKGLLLLALEKAEMTGSMKEFSELMKRSIPPASRHLLQRSADEDLADEPVEAKARLRLFRLTQRLLEEAPDGMEEGLMAEILGEGKAMVPYLAGVLNRAQSADRHEVEVASAPAALALLVETAGAEALPVVVDFGDHEDAALIAAAAWSGARLAKRWPQEVRTELARELDHLTEDTPVVGVMQAIYVNREEPGFVDLARKAIDAPRGLQKWQRDMMMMLSAGAMLAVDAARYESELRSALRINKKRMSREVAAMCADMLDGRQAMRPKWADEEVLALDLEEICRDAALLDTLPDMDEDDLGDEEDLREADDEDGGGWESQLRKELLSWATQHVPGECKEEAKRQFYAKDESGIDETTDDQFLQWLIYDYQCPSLKGSIAWDYLAAHPGLEEQRKRALLEWSSSHTVLAEVEKVDKGIGVHLADLLTGQKVFVHDVSSSQQLVEWDCILSRVQKEGERYLFSGNGQLMPRPTIRPVVEKLREEFAESKLDAASFYRQQFPSIRRRLLERLAEFRANIDVRTAEGDRLLISKAKYAVEDEGGARERLRQEPDFEKDNGGFAWFEPGPGDGRRILGTVRLTNKWLVLECMSKERLARGRELLERTLSGSIRHLGDTFEDPRELAMGDKRQKKERLPRKVEQEVIQQVLDKHYSTWPDEPLPALGGQTPREAVRTAEGRQAVEQLLRDFENANEHERRQGQPAYDFSKIRKELGLPRKS